MSERMPWPALMMVGLGRLRLSPDNFWAMTPRELRAALQVGQPAIPMDRTVLAALMARHPDGTGDGSHG